MFSQPARPIDCGSGQRAVVEGICDAALAKRLSTLSLWTDLVVIAQDPDFEGGHYIPVTTNDYHGYTWAGRSGVDDLSQPFEDHECQAILPTLRRAWKVAVVDPQWGRQDYLWRHLVALVEGRDSTKWKSSPSPALGLGVDFIT